MVRRLYHAEAALSLKPSEGCLQERPRWNVIRVENRDQLATCTSECVVNVSSLGVGVVIAGDVTCAYLRTKMRKFPPAAIVQHKYFELCCGIVQGQRAQHGCAHNAQRFVVGGNENINGRPLLWIACERHRRAV